MKITKTQLKRIIKEELASITEDQDMFAHMFGKEAAAKGYKLVATDVTIKPNGVFTAKLKSDVMKQTLPVTGQLDRDSTALLQQAGALKKQNITPLQQELNDSLDGIISAYQGSELPPPLSILKGLFNDRKHAESKDQITDLWNALLAYHNKTGTRLQHRVTTEFNTLNTLLRKMD
tara:strand:+ start:260 stop:787 length:528 start_codon:yes stop_codon:yes gene_type:complete